MALRKRALAPLSAKQDESVFRLPYRPPYDWESILAFLGTRAIPGVEEVVSGAYRRTFAVDGRHGILEVRNVAGVHALEGRIRFSRPLSLPAIVTRLRDMFDLAADTSAIARTFQSDPLLGRLVKRYPGLRVPGAWDRVELAVRAILGQQVTVAGASTLAGRLAARFGQPLSFDDTGGLSIVFPVARRIAGARMDGMPKARALAIRTLAGEIASGRLPADDTGDAFLHGLAAVKGIGDWTVQYIAMRALRHPDAFPASDLVLLRVAGQHGRLTARALLDRAERWRPWRAYAAMYLWRAASDKSRSRRRTS